MRIVSWVALALVAVVLIVFAVSNREIVSVGLWPLPAQVELPLYLLVLGTLLAGFVVGELVAWIGGRRWRREARRSRNRIAMLEREVEAARAGAGSHSGSHSPVGVIER
jgi:uncharacterized integral membrane protein